MNNMVKHVQVTFKVFCDTNFGDSLYLLGNIKELKLWSTKNAIPLNSDSYTVDSPIWESSPISLPLYTPIEYKFFKKTSNGEVEWEHLSGKSNRHLNLNQEDETEILTEFGAIQTQIQLQVSNDNYNNFEEVKHSSPVHRKFTIVLYQHNYREINLWLILRMVTLMNLKHSKIPSLLLRMKTLSSSLCSCCHL